MESVIRWLSPRPLLLFSPAFLLGLCMGGPLLPALGIFATIAPFTRHARWGKWALLILLGITAGQIRVRMIHTLPDIPAGENIQITGTVMGPSRHFHSRGKGMARFDIQMEKGKLQVRIYQKISPLLGGERVTLRGKILPLRPPMNPGQFDWADWLRRRGFRATIQANQIEVHSDPSLLAKIRNRIKKRWEQISPPEVSGLTAALLLGEREKLDPTFAEDLRTSGGAHFLALSGLHISVIGAAFWSALTILAIRRRWKLGILIALLWGYATLTGFPVSVVRATTMATFWLGADLLGRKRDALVSLAASALVILLLNPEERQNIGFQLSFLAVLGILLFLPLFPKSRIAGLFAVSLSAWATTSPLVQYHFNLLSPLFTLTNILAFPFVILVMAGGAASLLIEEASFMTAVAYEGLTLISQWLSNIPGGHFFRAAPAPEALTLYFLALGIFLVWMKRRPHFPKVF
ncbi:MAG: ComEC/Rec2 family competence protein, partial [Planctomycetota bacterium]|nr:ComEC/Rec2 family competence protein [Planctomycetota bacterium]